MAANISSENTNPENSTPGTTIPDNPERPPKSTPAAAPEPGFGWTQYAEQINGRFAMIGFIALLLMELFTHQDFFSWVGLR